MSWDEYYMGFAFWAAKRSTCLRKQVGAILVKENKIISTGYNGVATKAKHCDDYFIDLFEKEYKDKFENFDAYLKSEVFYNEHGCFSKKNELHAELNCLTFSSSNELKGSEIFVTLSPCSFCSKMLIAHRISRLVYFENYDRDTEGVDLLKDNNILVEQWSYRHAF